MKESAPVRNALPDSDPRSNFTNINDMALLESHPQTSVIVVNFNGGQKLLDCVASLRALCTDFECLVVDNASSDGSIEKLQALDSEVRIIRNPANYGFAKANNVGIRNASGSYIVLLNSDTVVTSGWLYELIKCVETDSRIGIATPKLLRLDGRLDSTGHVFRFEDVEATNRGEDEPDMKQYDKQTELLTCDFRCALIKRDVINQIGLLDNRIFFYHEDIDFCLRAKIAGWRTVYCPSSIVYHHRGGSTPAGQMNVLQRKRQRYLLRIALKNYERRDMISALIHKQEQCLISLLDTLAGIERHNLHYSRRKLVEAISFLEAILWNMLHPPVKERLAVKASRRVTDNELKHLSLRSRA
jgi:GT2 family glycosyltransferase